MTLAEARTEGGAAAVRAAIVAALAAHPTRAAAARSLGTTPQALAAAARRVGVVLAPLRAGRRKGG